MRSYTSNVDIPEAVKSKSKKANMRKFNTRNMNPVNVIRFGASHVGRNCGQRETTKVRGHPNVAGR